MMNMAKYNLLFEEVLLFWIISMLCRQAYSQGSVTEQCTKVINNCACQTKSGFINLAPLDAAKSSGQPRFQNVIDNDNKKYWFNPCTAFTMTSDCNSVASCVEEYSYKSPIGTQESSAFVFEPTSGTMLTYTAIDKYNTKRTTRLTLKCDKKEEGRLTSQGSPTYLTYLLTLVTKHACADTAIPPPGYGKGGLSTGTILIIIVLCLSVFYLVGGVLLNHFYRKKNGKEMIPNNEFWTELPGLVKDGAIFAYAKVRCQEKSQDKYDNA